MARWGRSVVQTEGNGKVVRNGGMADDCEAVGRSSGDGRRNRSPSGSGSRAQRLVHNARCCASGQLWSGHSVGRCPGRGAPAMCAGAAGCGAVLAGVRRGCWRRGRSRQPDPVAVAGMLTALHDGGMSWGEMSRTAGFAEESAARRRRGVAAAAWCVAVGRRHGDRRRNAGARCGAILDLCGSWRADGGAR